VNLNESFERLVHNELPLREYLRFERQCKRLVTKACRRYKIQDLVLNKTLLNDTIQDIYTKSLLKVIDKFDVTKSKFSTYFYYKSLSAARSEAGKLKRRLFINNTYSLDERRT